MESSEKTRVVILGSGTCIPSLSRSACSVLVAYGDTRFLLDIGPGTVRRLLEAGISIGDITHIGLSHHHPDHTAELSSFFFASRQPLLNRLEKSLTLIGGRGTGAFYARLKDLYGDWVDYGANLEIMEMNSGSRDERCFPDFTLHSSPVRHRPESIAFRITDTAGKSVVYSGDTDFSEDLVGLAEGAELLICESAFPEGHKVEGHLTPSLAGDIAARAGVKRLVLTHFYPECENADMVGACRKTYSGPLCLARDLLFLQLD
jgi:ribonuclease BN (tRNA processing enzyme)